MVKNEAILKRNEREKRMMRVVHTKAHTHTPPEQKANTKLVNQRVLDVMNTVCGGNGLQDIQLIHGNSACSLCFMVHFSSLQLIVALELLSNRSLHFLQTTLLLLPLHVRCAAEYNAECDHKILSLKLVGLKQHSHWALYVILSLFAEEHTLLKSKRAIYSTRIWINGNTVTTTAASRTHL